MYNENSAWMPNNDMFKNPAPYCLAANYFFNTICFFIDNNILKEKNTN